MAESNGITSVDLTLDGLMIPFIANYDKTYPKDFGTMIEFDATTNKGGLSTGQVNSNVLMPFILMRPKEVSETCITTRIEYDAKLLFTSETASLVTLGVGAYEGLELTLINKTSNTCAVTYTDEDDNTFNLSIPSNTIMKIHWVNDMWTSNLWINSLSFTSNDPYMKLAETQSVSGRKTFSQIEIPVGTPSNSGQNGAIWIAT